MTHLYPSFSIHLERAPFDARAMAINDYACALKIGDPGEIIAGLTIFFPASKLEQVQNIAALLNELSAVPLAPAQDEQEAV